MLTSLFVYFWAVFNDLDNIPLVPVKGSQDLGDFMFSLCWVSSKKLFYLQFILVIFFYFFFNKSPSTLVVCVNVAPPFACEPPEMFCGLQNFP